MARLIVFNTSIHIQIMFYDCFSGMDEPMTSGPTGSVLFPGCQKPPFGSFQTLESGR